MFYRIRDELERLQPRFRVKVFLSAEIDVLNSHGDLAVNPVKALRILDYISVAISHYYHPDAEQLLRDKIEDTIAMIKAVCLIPEVTMLMHPQIVYGRNVDDIARVIPHDVYSDVMKTIVENKKIVDYPSLELSQNYLEHLGYDKRKLSYTAQSFLNFTRALVAQHVLLAPGSDAHNIYWPYGSKKKNWLGNNNASLELLQTSGFTENQLWYFENRRADNLTY